MSQLYEITFPAQYPYVVAAACAISIQSIFMGFIVVGGARNTAFPQQWLEENFGRLHCEELQKHGVESKGPSKGGYPDCGSGRYSDKLTYENWFKFNVNVRIA